MSVDDDIAYWALTCEQADRYRRRVADLWLRTLVGGVADRLRLLGWILGVALAAKTAAVIVLAAALIGLVAA